LLKLYMQMQNFLIALTLLAFIVLLVTIYTLCFSNRVFEGNASFFECFNGFKKEYVSLEDIVPMQQSQYYIQICSTLPKIAYLLNEYRVGYSDALTAILRRKTPPVFSERSIDGYIDWTLLKKYMIDCEIYWYNLTQECDILQTDYSLAQAVKSSFRVFDLVTDVKVNDLADLSFDIINSHHIKAVYANRNRIVMPRVIIRTASYFGDAFEEYAPDYRWQTPKIAGTICDERQLLDEKLSGVLQVLGIRTYEEVEAAMQLS